MVKTIPPKIAVLVPCLNEALTIENMISDIRQYVPLADIYVCDNGSVDNTAQIAQNAGATVIFETRKGKGHAMRRMFSAIQADIYVMVDGDGTYDISALPMLIQTLNNQYLDVVIGGRANIYQDAKRKGHAFGNYIYNKTFAIIFGSQFNDIFSGYRVMSRSFVKSFPALSNGFEIETEMNVHIHQLGLSYQEIMLPYAARVEGSTSKLHSIKDGIKILKMFALLMKETKPFIFFSSFFCACILGAIILAVPIITNFLQTGLVPRLPTAILSMGLTLLGVIFLACGIILDSIARTRQELKRLAYLGVN